MTVYLTVQLEATVGDNGLWQTSGVGRSLWSAREFHKQLLDAAAIKT